MSRFQDMQDPMMFDFKPSCTKKCFWDFFM